MGNGEFYFPLTLSLTVLGRKNSLFPLGPVIKWLFILFKSKKTYETHCIVPLVHYVAMPLLFQHIHFCLITDIIKKYSNFVGFPIYLDGTCINTIQVFVNFFFFKFKHDLSLLNTLNINYKTLIFDAGRVWDLGKFNNKRSSLALSSLMHLLYLSFTTGFSAQITIVFWISLSIAEHYGCLF